MSWFFMLVLVVTIFGACVLIPAAIRHDRAEYHIYHGPDSGCRDCEEK